jgi:GNAT superfamily N-acetyltransferase
MLIRPLQFEDYDQAVDLKISCWDEELAGIAPNRLVKSEELDFILQWVATAEEHQDIRLVYGAFEGDELLAFAAASIAEPSDAAHGIELNYLFVKKDHRGQGLALRLIDTLLADFSGKGFEHVIVYNHHYAPSNAFYRKFGGTVMRQDIQGTPPDRLQIDVFVFDFLRFKEVIAQAVQFYGDMLDDKGNNQVRL